MKPWLKILVGLALGFLLGLFLFNFGKGSSVIASSSALILDYIGKAFINLLQMLVGLIIFSSLIVGMCHISDPKKMGRIGLTTIVFYILTTLVAIGIGLMVVFFIKPGANLGLVLPINQMANESKGLLDFLFSIVPSNPFASFANGNILQIIVFAIFLAIAINMTGEKGKLILSYIESLSDVMASLTHIVMRFAPYGVFALIATAVGAIGHKFLHLFSAVGCIFIAALIQIVIVFPIIIKFMAKIGVAPFFKGMKDAIVVAFTTSSSSATLPVSLECARDHLGISSDISGFVLSLGSTVNMNGTAIGQSVLAIFIAQAYGIEIGFSSIIILMFTTLVSAVGTAGVPGSGLIMLSIVLSEMGLPLEGIVYVAGIDRLRDMIATVVNILGDAVAAVYIAKKEKQIDFNKYYKVTLLD